MAFSWEQAPRLNGQGHSVLIAYIIAGLFPLHDHACIGRDAYIDPATGSFAKFASEYMHPILAISLLEGNIFCCCCWYVRNDRNWRIFQILVARVAGWLPGLVAITFLVLANLISVRMFGELEFWFALIKVVTIVLMIIAGLGVILFGIGNGGHPVGISNLWTHGGFSPAGLKVCFALSIRPRLHQGVELLGITAGEAENHDRPLLKQ